MEKINMVYACAGCADVGEVADQVGRKLRENGFATSKTSCLAGIGAGLASFIDAAKAANNVIAIDGCEIGCARIILENAGLKAHKAVITNMGLEKGKTTPSSNLTNDLCQLIVNQFNNRPSCD